MEKMSEKPWLNDRNNGVGDFSVRNNKNMSLWYKEYMFVYLYMQGRFRTGRRGKTKISIRWDNGVCEGIKGGIVVYEELKEG